jgi:hypothetical protein
MTEYWSGLLLVAVTCRYWVHAAQGNPPSLQDTLVQL